MLEQQLAVGAVYRFTFKPEFVRHGVCSDGQTCLHDGGGVFKIQQICTYTEIVTANINLYSNFFEPLGYSIEEYQSYYHSKPEDRYTPEYQVQKIPTEFWSNGRQVKGSKFGLVETGKSIRTRMHLEEVAYGYNPIYKLVDAVNPDDVLYAPEKTILGVPEVGMREYQNMTLAVDIGYWDDPSKLDGLIMSVRERLAAYGIIPRNVGAFSADSIWLSPDEYDAAVADRENRKGTLIELDETNYKKYAMNSVLVDGTFKTLVDDKTNPDVELGADDVGVTELMKNAITLDNFMFLRRCDDATFESDKQYFWKVKGSSNTYIKLKEGTDYGPGDSTMVMSPVEAGTGDYIDNGPVYDVLLDIKLAQNALAEGIQLHLKYVDEDGEVTYQPFTGTEISDDSTDAYYYMVQKHSYVPSEGGNLSSGASEYDGLYVLDYSAEAGMSLLGKRFTYTTRFGTPITCDVTPEQLVTLAGNTEAPRVRITNGGIANKYAGRWFEYTDELLDGTKVTYVTKISAGTPVKIGSGSSERFPTGSIYGTMGKSWSRVYVVTGAMERSYFKKYYDELSTNARLTAEIAALKAIILAANNKSSGNTPTA